MIDSHIHVGETEKGSNWVGVEELVRMHNLFDDWRAVIMPNVSNIISTENLNEKLIQDFKDMPILLSNRCYPYLLVDPSDARKCIRQLVHHHEHEMLFGVKYHPSIHQVTADSELLNPFWDMCAEFNIPALIHCGRNEKSSVRYVANAATAFPKTKFIAAHLGGNASELSERAINLLYDERHTGDNLWVDTSACKLPWLIELAVKKLSANRVLFGSDEPYADARMGKICIDFADISDKARELIFEDNMKHLLGGKDNGRDD